MAKKFGLDIRVGITEINLAKLVVLVSDDQIVYKPVPVFPEVAHDLAIIVDRDVSHGAIINEITKIDPLLKTIELFNCYEGDKIEKGKKSLAYHLIFGSKEPTLKTEEVDAAQKKIVGRLKAKFEA